MIQIFKIILIMTLATIIGYFACSKNIFNLNKTNALSFFMSDYEVNLSIHPKNSQKKLNEESTVKFETICESPIHLAITEYSGGAHCCFTTKIYSFEKTQPHLLETLDTLHSSTQSVRIDHKLYLQFYDWTFAYWKSCFASSPNPPKILWEFKDGRYQIALKAMQKEAPSSQKISENAALIAAKLDDKNNLTNEKSNIIYRQELVSNMLELIYSGNKKEALSLFEQSNSAPRAEKDLFLKEFYEQLHKSPYWKDIHQNAKNE